MQYYTIQWATLICYFLKEKYQIQIFQNTLKMTFYKSNNTKFSSDVIDTNSNITKYTQRPPNTGIFKVFRLFVKPNLGAWSYIKANKSLLAIYKNLLRLKPSLECILT